MQTAAQLELTEYYYIRNMKQSYVYILAPDKTAIPV
jgi:hypothetical protein